MAKTSTNPNYWFAADAITITPNARMMAEYVAVSVASGSKIKVFDLSLPAKLTSYYKDVLTTSNLSRLIDELTVMLGQAADLSYRTWVISGYNTVLAQPGAPYNIYMRLSTDGTALLVFSPDNEKEVELQAPEVDDDGQPIEGSEYELLYVWVKIGELTAPSVESGSIQPDRECHLDTGELDTAIGNRNLAMQGEWYETDASTTPKTVTMKEGWSFDTVYAAAVRSYQYLFKPRHRKAGAGEEWYTEEGLLLSTDSATIEADSTADSKDATLVTSGWLFGPFRVWLRKFFVRKDNTGTEEMQGSLKMGGSLSVGGTATVEDQLSTKKNLEVGTTATIGGHATVKGGLDVTGKITATTNVEAGGNLKIGGTANIGGKTTIDDDLDAHGSADIGKNLNVHGGATVDADLSVGQDVTVGRHLDAKNGTTTISDVTTTVGLDGREDSKNMTHNETMTGQGVAIYEDSDTVGHIVTDFLAVRRAAHFRELVIDEVSHVGGEMILSQAACQIARVVGYSIPVRIDAQPEPVYDSSGLDATPDVPEDTTDINFFRLFFETEANGKRQYNEWRPGDQVRCQSVGVLNAADSYDNVQTAYYWRVVTAVHSAEDGEEMHYIDVSNRREDITAIDDVTRLAVGPGCDVGCTTPQPNDSIALLGCRDLDRPSRSSAQVYSTIENNSPSRRYYQGITSFSFDGCAVEVMEWDATTAAAHWRVGSNAEDGDYIDFSKDGLRINAQTIMMKGQSVEEMNSELRKELEDALEAGFTIHEQTDDEDFLFPTPNDYTPDEGKTYPYRKQPYDSYTQKLANDGLLEQNAGNYYLTKGGFLFCLLPIDGDYYWHIVTDKYLIDAMAKVEGFTAEFTTQMNTINNWIKKVDPKGKLTEYVESGLVTTADYAKLYSTATDANGKTVEAKVQTTVKDGIASAEISADQIDLTGYTSINGGFQVDTRGNFEANTGTFGGFVKKGYHVIYPGNQDQYIAEFASGRYIDITRCGQLVMLVTNNGSITEDPAIHGNSAYVGDIEAISFPCYNGVENTGKPNSDWRNSYEIMQARQYLGSKVTIVNYTSQNVNLSGTTSSISGIGERDTFSTTLAVNSFGEFECVIFNGEDNQECVAWMQIAGGTLQRADKQCLFVPTYHLAADMIMDDSEDDMVSPQDRYVLQREWNAIMREYRVLGVENKMVSHLTPVQLEYQAAFTQLKRLLTEVRYEVPDLETYATFFEDKYMAYGIGLHDEDRSYYYQPMADAFTRYYAAADAIRNSATDEMTPSEPINPGTPGEL